MDAGDVGRQLRSHREALGLSLTEAAERTGASKLRLDLIERGAPPPPMVVPSLVGGLELDGELAAALTDASRTWRRPQPDDWGAGVCTVLTTNRATGGQRRKEWHYFVLDRRIGPCFLEPAGTRARWVRDLLADPRVRLVVNDGVYEGVARIVSGDDDGTTLTAVKDLFRRRYGRHGDPALDDLLASDVAVVATDDP